MVRINVLRTVIRRTKALVILILQSYINFDRRAVYTKCHNKLFFYTDNTYLFRRTASDTSQLRSQERGLLNYKNLCNIISTQYTQVLFYKPLTRLQRI